MKYLTDAELAYWEAKPQSEKDWWDANTKPEDRPQILRTEIAVAANYESFLRLPSSTREAITKRLEEEADAARIRIRQRMTTPIQVLRWICVLPGAVLCALLVAFPIHWIVMLIQLFGRSDDSFITIDGKNLLAAIPPETLERFGQALFAPFVVVLGGARIAPRYRFRTGIALTVLFVVGLIVAHIFVASWGFNLAGGWFQRSFAHLLQIVGFSWGLYHAHEADKNA